MIYDIEIVMQDKTVHRHPWAEGITCDDNRYEFMDSITQSPVSREYLHELRIHFGNHVVLYEGMVEYVKYKTEESKMSEMKTYIISMGLGNTETYCEVRANSIEHAYAIFGNRVSEQIINNASCITCREKEEPPKPFNLDSCNTIDLVNALIKRNGIEIMDSKYKEVRINIDGKYQNHCYEQLRHSGKI